MYNACIWGHSENRRILGIQYSALLGVGRVCPISGLVEETEWVSFSMTIKLNILLRAVTSVATGQTTSFLAD